MSPCTRASSPPRTSISSSTSAQSGAAVTQQLTGGSLDVALSVGITDPIRAIEKGAPLALIRIVGNSAPYVLIGKPELKSIADLKGKTISTGADNDITTVYFERMMAANGHEEGRLHDAAGRRRSRALCRAQGRRRRCRGGAAAGQLPGRQARASSRSATPRTIVKDLPFTGMAVHRRWAAANMSAAKRVLAATDKSVAWLADPAHRDEAIELLVKVARSSKEDAEASYDYLRRIEYFEPSSKVSRTKLRNLVAMEQHAGTVPAGVRHRTPGDAGPHRTHGLKRGNTMKFHAPRIPALGGRRCRRPCPPPVGIGATGASPWPTRVVRMIVGFPPGGGADSAARIAAARLSEMWGQQVVIENKGGAGGNIAHDTAAHAPPDGYTILFSPSSLPIMPMLYPSLNYDPMTDLVPISTLGKYPNLIVVSKNIADDNR